MILLRGYETLTNRLVRVYLDDGTKPLKRIVYHRYMDNTYWINYEKMFRQVEYKNGVYHLNMRKDKPNP